MFVQVIQGQVADANAVHAVLQRWIDQTRPHGDRMARLHRRGGPGRDLHHARPLRVRGGGAVQQ